MGTSTIVQVSSARACAQVILQPFCTYLFPAIHAARRVHRGAGSNLWGGEVITAVQQLASGQDLRSASGALMSGKMHDVVAAQYFQDHSASNPLISPVLASEEVVCRFPPVLLHAADDEPLAPDSVQMAALCSRAGVRVELQLYPQVTHVFQSFPLIYPHAAEDSMARIVHFLESVWPEEVQQPLQQQPLQQQQQTYSVEELHALPVRELRAMLQEQGVSAEGCIEKRDLVNAVRQLRG